MSPEPTVQSAWTVTLCLYSLCADLAWVSELAVTKRTAFQSISNLGFLLPGAGLGPGPVPA